jgi:DNA-binding NtrC family response regulator
MKDKFDGLVDHLLNGGIFMQEAIEVLEKYMIQGALERCDRNQSAASKALGIHRNTLQRKMVEYQLGSVRIRPRRKPVAGQGRPRNQKISAA